VGNIHLVANCSRKGADITSKKNAMCPDRPEEVAGAPDQVGTSLEKFIIGVCLERIPASLLPPD